jgi:AraC family transcriptional regulator
VLSPVRIATSKKYRKSLLPVLVHIEDHLDEPLSLHALAAVAGFAPHHFHRVFQHVVGEAPKEYLRRLRLERAVYRLKVSPDNILQIALDAGFKTHETFTRAFTRQFDISPSEFRAVLKAYRAGVDETLGSYTFAGFSLDSQVTLRFDQSKEPVSIQMLPAQQLIFKRHIGHYEKLIPAGENLTYLWQDLFAFCEEHGIQYSQERLIGISHDDPYVTEEAKIRFDACLPISQMPIAHQTVGYRRLQPGMCVSRRHQGGLEEIAKTFAFIGVEWLPTENHHLKAGLPFEVYHFHQGAGQPEFAYTDSYVPLEPFRRNNE